jgi:hypothetical protein
MDQISRASRAVVAAVALGASFLFAGSAAAQVTDTLTLGTVTLDYTTAGSNTLCAPSGSGFACDVKVPVYIKDNSGSPAGEDVVGAPINGYQTEVNFGIGATALAAGSANTCIEQASGGVILGATSANGNNPGPLGTIGQPSLFTGKTIQQTASVTVANSQALFSVVLNLVALPGQDLAFNQSAAGAGDFMGFINFTLTNCPSGVINLFPDSNTQTAGPVVQTIGNGLVAVPGSITVIGGGVAPTPTVTGTPAGVPNTPTVTPTTGGPTNTPTQTPTAGAATNTPTRTPTVVAGIPTNTPTRTPTAVPPTATSTATPTPESGPEVPTPIPTLDTRALAALAVLLAAVGLMLTKRLMK